MIYRNSIISEDSMQDKHLRIILITCFFKLFRVFFFIPSLIRCPKTLNPENKFKITWEHLTELFFIKASVSVIAKESGIRGKEMSIWFVP